MGKNNENGAFESSAYIASGVLLQDLHHSDIYFAVLHCKWAFPLYFLHSYRCAFRAKLA